MSCNKCGLDHTSLLCPVAGASYPGTSQVCGACGQIHSPTTGCPTLIGEQVEKPPVSGDSTFQCTINGLTPGEQAIVERLDKVIELLSNMPRRMLDEEIEDIEKFSRNL